MVNPLSFLKSSLKKKDTSPEDEAAEGAEGEPSVAAEEESPTAPSEAVAEGQAPGDATAVAAEGETPPAAAAEQPAPPAEQPASGGEQGPAPAAEPATPPAGQSVSAAPDAGGAVDTGGQEPEVSSAPAAASGVQRRSIGDIVGDMEPSDEPPQVPPAPAAETPAGSAGEAATEPEAAVDPAETPAEAVVQPTQAATEPPAESPDAAPAEASAEPPVEAAPEAPVDPAPEAAADAATQQSAETPPEGPPEAQAETPEQAAPESPDESAPQAAAQPASETPVEEAGPQSATEVAEQAPPPDPPVPAAETPAEAEQQAAETAAEAATETAATPVAEEAPQEPAADPAAAQPAAEAPAEQPMESAREPAAAQPPAEETPAEAPPAEQPAAEAPAARQRSVSDIVGPAPEPVAAEPAQGPPPSRASIEATARATYTEALQTVGRFFKAGRQGSSGGSAALPVNDIESVGAKLVSGMSDQHVGDALVAYAVGPYPDEDRFIVPHSVNVAILSQRVGRHLGLQGQELQTLAVAGLVHDVGTVRIHKDTFYKDDSLTNEEWEQMRQRPTFSAEIIEGLGPQYRAVAEIAHQVHERLDGNGYPRGLTVDNIALEASILGAVDIFEAFIHPRPYKKTVPAAAMYGVDNLMRMSHQFGDGVLKALVRSVGLFPVGTHVRLNSGEVARVLRGRSANPMRPEVEVVYDTQKRKLKEPRYIDLMATPHLYVFKPLSPEELVEYHL